MIILETEREEKNNEERNKNLQNIQNSRFE